MYSNHKNLEQEKQTNELQMQEQIKLNENLISQKNDIALQVQSIERKADGIR